MTNERRQFSTLPILLGMALSLLVLFLVVGRADAKTICEQCEGNAMRKAELYCLSQGYVNPSYQYDQCLYNTYMTHRNNDCMKSNPPKCPNGNNTGQSNCGAEGCRFLRVTAGTCGEKADAGAGTICTNECWGRFCPESTTGTCADVPASAPGVTNTLCHTQCGCKE